MGQPIPKKILESNPDVASHPFYTLLIDGSNLLQVSFMGDKRVASDGRRIGGVFQLLLQIKLLLRKGNFDYVYAMWDGERSGQMRFNIYPDYKANRDKTFDDAELSMYMKAVNEKIRRTMKYIEKKKTMSEEKIKEKEAEKEEFYREREIVMQCLEELFVRQCLCNEVEADDLIAYYVKHKKKEEKIVIVSNDRDLTQLIRDDVTVYLPNVKKFITPKNHKELMGYPCENVVVKKILCGDTSDNIKGIKGLGEATLFKNIPEFTQRRMSLDEVLRRSNEINEQRVAEKKKPLKWAENVVNRVTDGVQGDKIYEINKAIIDLSDPLLTPEAIDYMKSLMYNPLDPEGRTMQNLYTIITENHIDDLVDPDKFSNFFSEYMNLIEKEEKRYNNS